MNGSITTAYDRVFKNIDRRLRIVENRETPSSGGGGGTTIVHAHINDTSGGVIDYLRTQWGTDHLAAADPHTQYLNQARGDARYSLIAHNHNAAYAALGTTITAGSGLTGGGDLSANRTLNVGAGTGITVAADTIAVDQTYLDSRYALTGHNHDTTYATRTTTITAGAGLAGGGDLTTNRTLDVGAGTGIVVAADTVAVDQTWADGRYALTGHNHDAAYVNVTGDAMTGPLTISGNAVAASPDTGNSLVWHANGFFVAAGSIPISADPDNVIQMLADGLFVRKGLIFGK
jgi:hypothetical protein